MIDERTQDLMQRVQDGEATPEETVRLRARVASDSEALAAWEALETAGRALRSVDLVDPPQAWKDELLHSLRVEAARPPRPAPVSRLDGFLAGLRAQLTPRAAFAFAAGAACALAFFAALRPGRLDTDAMPGALLSGDRITAAAGPAAQASLTLDGARAQFRSWSVDGSTLVEIEATAEELVEIEIEIVASGDLRARAFDQTPPGVGWVRVDADRVRITHRGRERYRLSLAGAGEAANLLVRLRCSDRAQEATLQTIKKGS
jgi:hypothetical protein